MQTSFLVGLGRRPPSHGHPRPNAAGYADRVLFLGDGHIVDEMAEPAAERVLDRMKSFDAAGHAT